MKKQTGIWLDLRDAWVINLSTEHDGEIVAQHIASGVEENAAIQTTRMDTQWGPHGGNNQKTVQERQHHQEKDYFTNILQHIQPATDELVIFGPSEAKFGLENLIQNQSHGYHKPKLMGVETTELMTERQIEAWVRDYFGRAAARKQPKFGQAHS